MTTVALALGSNLGERDRFLASARTLLQAGGLLRVTAASPLYETEPVGGPAQPDYLNQVVLAEWGGTPEELLQLTSAVEIALGPARA